jgi:CRISPR/Cas system CMR-associated protein Cmr5 small subunit
MRNLDQIRAAHAIGKRDIRIPGTEGGEVVKKVPMLIRQNGLLAALAFACERGRRGGTWKNEGHHRVFEFVVEHLARCPSVELALPDGGDDLVVRYNEWLANQSSAALRLHTAEIMAYLGYLRRYVQREEE